MVQYELMQENHSETEGGAVVSAPPGDLDQWFGDGEAGPAESGANDPLGGIAHLSCVAKRSKGDAHVSRRLPSVSLCLALTTLYLLTASAGAFARATAPNGGPVPSSNVSGKKLIRIASELVSRLLDSPSVAEAALPAKVKIWQETGLDGLVFSMASHDPTKGERNMSGQWWNLVRREYREFIPEVEAFQAVGDWGRLTDNFLWSSMAIWGEKEPGYPCQDWFSDKDWDVILANVRLQAKVAKDCGFKGILLDTEQYDHHGRGVWRVPFNYAKYADSGYKLEGRSKPRPFLEVAAEVRQRGEQYARAITSEFPNITLIVIPGLYEVAWAADFFRVKGPVNSESTLQTNCEGLYPAFIDGLLRGLPDQSRIVGGTEGTYSLSLYKDMLVVRDMMLRQSTILSEDPEAARKRISVAVGIWTDATRRFSETDVTVNFRNPEQHKHAVHNALAASDHYAWVYGETSRFLTSKPTALIREYLQANEDAHQPLDLGWQPQPEAGRAKR